MREIIEDLKRECFTVKDWVISAIGTIAFVLISGLAGIFA